MWIQAGQGLWLTQKGEIPSSDRIFRNDRFYVATAQQADEWVEITGDQKKALEDEMALFAFDNLNYRQVKKIDQLNTELPAHINDAGLTNNEALELQQYFPTWEQCWGKDVLPGFKFIYEGVLLEVVTAHTMSEEINPAAQPMTLILVDGEDMPPMRYRIVEYEAPAEEIPTDNSNTNADPTPNEGDAPLDQPSDQPSDQLTEQPTEQPTVTDNTNNLNS